MHGGVDGPTARVAQNHHQVAAQVILGVLDAAQLMLVHHVAGHADDEQVADARREDGLGNHT